MTTVEPIDLDTFKFEEDLYGEPVKSEAVQEKDEYDSDPDLPYMPPLKKARYSKPSHKRHPEDADTEDRVLVSLVDGGWDWRWFPSNHSQLM